MKYEIFFLKNQPRVTGSKSAGLMVRYQSMNYDIKIDKFERKNLANNKKYKGIKQTLLRKIVKWMKITKDPLLKNQIQSPFFLDTLKQLK